jgi:hypothetical protein
VEASFIKIEVNDSSLLWKGLMFARYQAVVRGQVLPRPREPKPRKTARKSASNKLETRLSH